MYWSTIFITITFVGNIITFNLDILLYIFTYSLKQYKSYNTVALKTKLKKWGIEQSPFQVSKYILSVKEMAMSLNLLYLLS